MKYRLGMNLRHNVWFGGFALVWASVVNGCGDYSDRSVETTGTSAPATSDAETMTPTSSAPTSTAPTTTTPASTTAAETPATETVAQTSATETAAPSTPPDAVCEAVAACGGDVVGTWAAKSSCLTVDGDVNMTGFGLGCSESPTTGELAVSGNWTFTADGMVTDETTTTGSANVGLLAECLTISGTVTACDRVGSAITTMGYLSATCADDAATGGCSCPATADQMGGAASVAMRPIQEGTYTLAENVISIQDNRNNLNEYSYCVQGDIMIASLKSIPKAGPVTGQIVFQRQ